MVAGEGHAVSAAVAPLAMPLPPIPAHATGHTVPGVELLDDILPAERIPVKFIALGAGVSGEEIPQGGLLALARQIHLCIEFRLREHLVLLDMVQRAMRHVGDIEAIEGVVADRVVAAISTRLVVFKAGTAPGSAAVLAATDRWFFYKGAHGQFTREADKNSVRTKR
jgi:hypothetical protein